MRKNNIKQLLKMSVDSSEFMVTTMSDFDPLFQHYEKNLYKIHNIPKIKIHQAKFW